MPDFDKELSLAKDEEDRKVFSWRDAVLVGTFLLTVCNFWMLVRL